MHYELRVSTPAGTLQTAPVRTRLEVTPGVIVQIGASFPPGPQGALHLRVKHGEHQIFPANEGQDLAWDELDVAAVYRYEVKDEPLELVLETWNDDAVNAHLCRVGVNIIDAAVVRRGDVELGIINRLGQFLFGPGGGG